MLDIFHDREVFYFKTIISLAWIGRTVVTFSLVRTTTWVLYKTIENPPNCYSATYLLTRRIRIPSVCWICWTLHATISIASSAYLTSCYWSGISTFQRFDPVVDRPSFCAVYPGSDKAGHSSLNSPPISMKVSLKYGNKWTTSLDASIVFRPAIKPYRLAEKSHITHFISQSWLNELAHCV